MVVICRINVGFHSDFRMFRHRRSKSPLIPVNINGFRFNPTREL